MVLLIAVGTENRRPYRLWAGGHSRAQPTALLLDALQNETCHDRLAIPAHENAGREMATGSAVHTPGGRADGLNS